MHYNDHLKAFLDDNHLVVIQQSKDFYLGKSKLFYLKDETNKLVEMTIGETIEHNDYIEYKCYVDYKFEIGNKYFVYQEHSLSTILQYRYIVKTKSFNDEFTYKGKLGVDINESFTTFTIWAPTSSSVTIVLDDQSYMLERTSHGVYVIKFEANLHLSNYYYLVEVNGKINKTLDPYAVASGSNSRYNTVVDFRKLDKLFNHELTHLKTEEISVIEINIRDLTNEYQHNKSTFAAASESSTKDGYSIGFDYITSLGFSHVQIMPVNDFVTVDEDNPEVFYNWGYDPLQYFTLEGSYSLNPDNPLERIIGLRRLVNKFHKNNMRVNLDVVFNHVYDYQSSVFQQVVPYYYFRYDDNYQLSNGSYCGNDLDTKQPMMRKLIIDCLSFYVSTYDIDGFRFDLLGIIDTETSKQASNALHQLKKDIMLYGEGWEMPTAINEEEMSTMYNADQLKDYSFFNDYFRDTVGGSIFMPDTSIGYLLGDSTKLDSFVNCLKGVNPLTPTNKHQLINYVECHDNYTLWDSISKRLPHVDKATRSNIHRLVCGAVVFAQGIPFIQLGQEFMRSKNNESNSYRSSDEINRIHWNLMIENNDMVEYFKQLLRFRNDHSTLWSNEVDVHIKQIDNCLYYNLSNNEYNYTVIFNPTKDLHIYDDKYKQVFVSSFNEGIVNLDNVVNPHSLVICEMKL